MVQGKTTRFLPLTRDTHTPSQPPPFPLLHCLLTVRHGMHACYVVNCIYGAGGQGVVCYDAEIKGQEKKKRKIVVPKSSELFLNGLRIVLGSEQPIGGKVKNISVEAYAQSYHLK